jgi:hypothetical protein
MEKLIAQPHSTSALPVAQHAALLKPSANSIVGFVACGPTLL